LKQVFRLCRKSSIKLLPYKGVTQQKHYSSNAARYIKRKNKNISGMIFLA